jgi:hypothetical protein
MTIEKIQYGIYKWGFYPALFLLREMQDNEMYEDCALMKQALDSVIIGREWYLNTKVDNDSLDDTYKKIMKGLHNHKEIIESIL